MRTLPLLVFLIAASTQARAQPFSLLIKNGFVIDPKTALHDTLDIAIQNGRIAHIAKHIDSRQAAKIIDARGAIVCPGLIDTHTHVFFGSDPDREYDGGTEGLTPDKFAPREGVTTVVDAGSSGWRDFEVFKHRVIDHSHTRVLAFLNIVGAGMRGGPYEQDTTDMNDSLAAAEALQYQPYIIGFKVAHYPGRRLVSHRCGGHSGKPDAPAGHDRFRRTPTRTFHS